MNGKHRIDWTSVRTRLNKVQRATEQGGAAQVERFAQVLCERARQLAARSIDAPVVAASTPFLVCKLGVEKIGWPLSAVAEVVTCRGLRPLPGSGPNVRGLINVRGEVVAVIDLASLLALPEQKDRADGPVLLARWNKRLIGLLVDAAERTTHVDPDVVLPFSSLEGGPSFRFAWGRTNAGLTLIDHAKLLATIASGAA